MCPNWFRMSVSNIVCPTQEQGLCRALAHPSCRSGNLVARDSALDAGGSDCLRLGEAEQVEFLIPQEVGGFLSVYPQNTRSCWLDFLLVCILPRASQGITPPPRPAQAPPRTP